MKTATDTRLLFNRFSLQMLRNPVWLFVGFSTPILYLVLFTPLLDDLSKGRQFGGTSVLDVFLPGILALLAFASGSASGFSTIFELQSGVIETVPGHAREPVRDPHGTDPVGPRDDDGVRRGASSRSARRSASTSTSAACSCWRCCSRC